MRPELVGMRSSWSFGLVAIMLLSTPISLTPAGVNLPSIAGKLEGHVRDSTGLPLPSAQVWIDGSSYGGVSDTRGYYFIENIPPRVVDLTVTLVGYRRVQMKGVRISEGNTIAQDFSIEPVRFELDGVVQGGDHAVLRDNGQIDTVPRAPSEGREKINVARIATGILEEISSAVIDSAKRALVGRLLGSRLKGLSGEVTTLTGQPIGGARVEVDGASYVLTGADGKFLIQPTIGRKLTLRVSAPGFSTLETPLDKLKGGEGRRVSLRLKK